MKVDPQCRYSPVMPTAWPYLNARGQFFPCCWIDTHHTREKLQQFLGDELYSVDANSIDSNSIKDGTAWQKIRDSWTDGSFDTCMRFCGKEQEFSTSILGRDTTVKVNLRPSKGIHLEPTSRCTLACPQCARTMRPDLLTIDDIVIDTAVAVCRNFDEISLCGNHGDPIYHPQFHELLIAIRAANPNIAFHMHTNGAFRQPDWWQRSAEIFKQRDIITFSIDGLPSNNHIYRVNSKWETVQSAIEIMRSINPRIKMVWKWILFNYNQENVSIGKELAERFDFDEFVVVKGYRNQWSRLNPTISFDDAVAPISTRQV
jgi:Radical SAM superfamily